MVKESDRRPDALRVSRVAVFYGVKLRLLDQRVAQDCDISVGKLSRERRSAARGLACRVASTLVSTDTMKSLQPHRWDVTTTEAREIQIRLRSRVSRRGKLRHIRYVAGVDLSIRGDRAVAAIPVLRWDDLELIELATSDQHIQFPYVPGLLSFREIPAILAAAEQLTIEPDLILVDGQGIAHQRRFGLASHLGVLLDKPTIGCAKTGLIGMHDEPYEEAGSYTDLFDGVELIGAVLRTRTDVKPLYISVGHKVELSAALDCVLDCCTGYRLPEPTRLAHQAAGATLLRAISKQ